MYVFIYIIQLVLDQQLLICSSRNIKLSVTFTCCTL